MYIFHDHLNGMEIINFILLNELFYFLLNQHLPYYITLLMLF